MASCSIINPLPTPSAIGFPCFTVTYPANLEMKFYFSVNENITFEYSYDPAPAPINTLVVGKILFKAFVASFPKSPSCDIFYDTEILKLKIHTIL